MPAANVCSQLDSAICSCGSGSGGYNIHMQQSTSPIVRHPAPHGKPPTLMPRKQVLVFLTLMTTNQQCCDRLNKNCSEIIVWHLTPCWKIILMGSDPGKIMFNPEIIFAWFQRSIWFLHENDNYFWKIILVCHPPPTNIFLPCPLLYTQTLTALLTAVHTNTSCNGV